MYLNLHGEHFSYIQDFAKYSSAYRCTKCSKIMNRHYNLQQHLKVCDAATKSSYGRGAFHLPESVFDRLKHNGIDIPESLRYFEHRICFDIECTLTQNTGIANTQSTDFTFKHELASISVCSNVPEFTEPVCLVSDGCPERLMKRCIEYMTEIAEEVKLLQREKFADYIDEIEELDNESLVEEFLSYTGCVPVLSYNGSKYDLRVCRGPLISTLLQLDDVKYVIKRGNSYSCIATENFKFLDIANYLPVGTSYDGFLKAFQASTQKSFFCYEYFTSLEKLSDTVFPTYEDFYSSLRQRNTLEPQKHESLTDDEMLIIGRRPTISIEIVCQGRSGIGYLLVLT